MLAEVADQITIALERISELSTNVKNVVVANALFSEDLANVIQREHQRKK